MSLRKTSRACADVAGTACSTLREYVRLDVPIVIFALVWLAFFAPLVPRNTDNPQLLAAYSNDEPFLTMALEATLVAPYGNPGTYFDPQRSASSHLPKHWADMRYANITYYGGAMFELALPAYATLRAAGLPPFPTGPTVLRILTLLAGLVSLVVLYNIAKERGLRIVGLLAAAYMASDGYFLYYADFIHPDTLQMLFGFGAFVLAVKHAREGRAASVVALGLFCGIIQGTKAGGAWTLPMALLAIWLGARVRSTGHASDLVRRLALRALAFAAAAVTGFFVTTPYAFIDSYYLRSLRIAYGIVTQNALHLEHISLLTWAETIYHYIGPVAAALVALTVVRMIWLTLRRKPDHALTLAVLLSLSQFVWFGGTAKLWQIPGYLLLSFGLMALFAYETLFITARAVASRAARARPRALVQKAASVVTVMVVVVLFASWRWYLPVSYVVDQHTTSHSTVRAANTWAVSHHVSSKSVIVVDDLAYFDRRRFPKARLYGGVLTWNAVNDIHPDFIVLSSSLFGAAWMQHLIATEHLARRNPNPYNVRLYQDLLAARVPGPTKAGGVELVGVIRPSPAEPAALRPTRIGDLARACGGAALCDLGPVDLSRDFYEAADIERRVRALANVGEKPLVGPELRIFRVRR